MITIIEDYCEGTLKSRVGVTVTDAHVHEFSFGVKNPLLSHPMGCNKGQATGSRVVNIDL